MDRKSIAAVLVFLLGLTLAVSLATRGVRAQGGGPQVSLEGKKAEEVYKNIQVLKGIPAEQLIPTMQFIASSLGVGCEFCHVEPRDKDDKPTKATARKMIQMVMAINKDDFDARQTVTCYTCHRGANDPVGTPLVADENFKPAAPEPPAGGPGGAPGNGNSAATRPPAGPAPEQLLSGYMKALGGADAVAKVSSRVEKGTTTDPRGRSTPIEIFSKSSGMHLLVSHGQNGDTLTEAGGTSGWTSNAQRGPRDMVAADIDGAHFEDDLWVASHLQQAFTQFRAGRPDTVNGHDTYVITGLKGDQPAARLYFDKDSGMLLRLLYFTPTALGRLPTQIDYADYRDSDGVKVPYKWVISKPTSRVTYQIDQLQQNVPVDDSKFAKPAGGPPAQAQNAPGR